MFDFEYFKKKIKLKTKIKNNFFLFIKNNSFLLKIGEKIFKNFASKNKKISIKSQIKNINQLIICQTKKINQFNWKLLKCENKTYILQIFFYFIRKQVVLNDSVNFTDNINCVNYNFLN